MCGSRHDVCFAEAAHVLSFASSLVHESFPGKHLGLGSIGIFDDRHYGLDDFRRLLDFIVRHSMGILHPIELGKFGSSLHHSDLTAVLGRLKARESSFQLCSIVLHDVLIILPHFAIHFPPELWVLRVHHLAGTVGNITLDEGYPDLFVGAIYLR